RAGRRVHFVAHEVNDFFQKPGAIAAPVLCGSQDLNSGVRITNFQAFHLGLESFAKAGTQQVKEGKLVAATGGPRHVYQRDPGRRRNSATMPSNISIANDLKHRLHRLLETSDRYDTFGEILLEVVGDTFGDMRG